MAQEPLVGQAPLIIDDSRSHSITYTTLGRISLDEWSARRRGLYLTKQQSQETEIPAPRGSEPAIPASERPQTHALDRPATGSTNYVCVCVCVCVYIYIYI